MIKTDYFTLENGLKIVMCQDNARKSACFEILTHFGGDTEGFIINNKKHIITKGLAHLMEHALIDKGPYGNALEYFQSRYASFNGYTTGIRTGFYVNDILDIEKSMVALMQTVNKIHFTSDDLENIKKPVLEEIRRAHDNRFRNVREANNECFYHYEKPVDNLGTVEEVESITFDEIKLCHDVFYQPHNQIICISGKFDMEKVKDIILNTYKELDIKTLEYTLITHDEPATVAKKGKVIIDSENEEYTNIRYKIKDAPFTPYELVKLSFYLEFFINHNFKDGTDIYNYMVDNKYMVYSIDCSCSFNENLASISIGAFTSHVDEFISRVQDIITKKPINEEEFKIWKNNVIISIILREEHPGKMLSPFLDNILTFHYEHSDTVEDINSLNIEELKEYLNRIDFSEYCIISRLKEEI
ncbi:MAG: insulinase family protein [Bacilli bacterium]|nr:insulinase family protein [Bacilli bacterium]